MTSGPAQKAPSSPCGLVAPGNWNASGWVPVCRQKAGHEGAHVADGAAHFPQGGRPWRALDYTWPNSETASDAALDELRRRLSGPRWRVGRSVGRTLYLDDVLVGVMDTPELAAQVVAALTTPTDEEPTRG